MTTSRNPVTAPPIVPEPGDDPIDGEALAERHTRRLWTAVAVAAGAVVGSIAYVDTVELDHYAFSPGNAFPTGQLVTVEEGAAETFDDPGEVYFLTARSGSLNVLEGLWAWIDGDVDVLPASSVLGGLTPEENRRRQAEAMVGSKNTAMIVAFEHLGIPLDPTGTGATVMETPVEGSPAAEVIRAADTITAVDGDRIRLSQDLGEAIGSRPPGTEVTLTIEDADGVEREEVVTLAARPDDSSKGFLGVVTDTRDFDPRPAFDVDIQSGRVGGPSAGLAFTLTIIDVLTEGSLTGGLDVAVTGVIAEDGSVLPVGGVAQKTVAARAAGADVMIVPEGLAVEARGAGDMAVYEVADLDEALELLESLGGDPVVPPEVATRS